MWTVVGLEIYFCLVGVWGGRSPSKSVLSLYFDALGGLHSFKTHSANAINLGPVSLTGALKKAMVHRSEVRSIYSVINERKTKKQF